MVFLPHEPTFFHGKPLINLLFFLVLVRIEVVSLPREPIVNSLFLNHHFLHRCAAVGLYLHRVHALGYIREVQALLLHGLRHHLSLGVAQGDALRSSKLNVQLNSRFIK